MEALICIFGTIIAGFLMTSCYVLEQEHFRLEKQIIELKELIEKKS